MNGNYLLDTNAIIALLEGNESVKALLAGHRVLIPSIVTGEMYYGAYRSNRARSNVQRLETFIENRQVLNCDVQTGKFYGAIKNRLRAKGRPIPENDIWIAAIAQQYHLPLVTRDAHFDEVEGLSVVRW